MKANANLNTNQSEAVFHKDGPMMVLAGPGSGKTTVITYRTLHMIRHWNIPASKILVITFSKAAATQMENRFRALAEGENCTFGTFHSVFFRVLRQRYGYTVEQILQEGERREMVKKSLAAMEFEADEDTLASILNEISNVKNELCNINDYDSAVIAKDIFRQLFIRYEETKYTLDKIDFDDMLVWCYHLWTAEPQCLAYWQNQYPYIMIDEFQDINLVQYECIRLLAAPDYHLCVVGDDDQSIYSFRGARPEFLLRFPEDYPQVKQVTLDINYRSTSPIISLSNSIISNNRVRYEKNIKGTERDGPKPSVLNFKNPDHEASTIASQIKKLEDLDEVAVIYRTNIQARAFMDAFMQANIPYVVKDELSVIYEHWIAKDWFAYLRLGNCGMDIGDIERVINKPFRYINKAFIQKARKDGCNIFEIYARSEMLNAAQKQRIEELTTHLRTISKRPTSEALGFIRRIVGYDEYIADYCNYRKASPTGLLEIANELQEAAKSFPKAEDFILHGLDAIQAAKQNDRTTDDDTARVTLSTMHSAKGLEFGTVYIASAVEGLVPHERSTSASQIEEERRLFYVGVTRAKDRLYISVPSTRHDKKIKPSRFICKSADEKSTKNQIKSQVKSQVKNQIKKLTKGKDDKNGKTRASNKKT